MFQSAKSGKEGLRCGVESAFVNCTLERIWTRTRTIISKTWCDREGWKSRGSLAWGSLRVGEGNMQYANLQIYRGLFQEAQVFLCPLQVGQGIHSSGCSMLISGFLKSTVTSIFLWL